MNTLCFDFGNTRLKVACFQNTKLTEVIVIDNDSLISIENLLKRFDFQKSILSSVINHNPEIENLLSAKTKPRTSAPCSVAQRAASSLRIPQIFTFIYVHPFEVVIAFPVKYSVNLPLSSAFHRLKSHSHLPS